MMRCWCSLGDRIQPCLRDYGRLQSLAVVLIYIQVSSSSGLDYIKVGVLLAHLPFHIDLFFLAA